MAGGAHTLNYNGVPYSAAAIQEGQYTFWSYEHLYYYPGAAQANIAKAIAAQIQTRALETVPYIPLGQIFQPTAFRSGLQDIVQAAIPLFWGVRRG